MGVEAMVVLAFWRRRPLSGPRVVGADCPADSRLYPLGRNNCTRRVFTQEVRVKLAWRSTSLRAACRSSDAISTRWPKDGEAAKLLLSTVAHAQDLAQLRRLLSVGVQSAHTTRAEVLVLLEEIQMQAVVLTPSGEHAGATSANQFWSRHGSSTALLVLDLRAQGLALLRTAS